MPAPGILDFPHGAPNTRQAGAALHTGEGHPVGDAIVPPFEGPDGLLRARPECRLLFDFDDAAAWERSDVDLIFMLPLGPGPHRIASSYLGEMVAVLDRGGRIALHGTHVEAVEGAICVIVALAGGGRA